MILYPTNEELKEIAKNRAKLHEHKESSRNFSKRPLWEMEYIGLMGERAFAMQFGLEMDLKYRPFGDNGVDNHTELGTVDVKTAETPIYLFREVGKKASDILVLAKYDRKSDDAWLIGWEFDEEMLKEPKKGFGYSTVNHYKHYSQLKRMEELELILA